MDFHVQLDSDASSVNIIAAGGIGRSCSNSRESLTFEFSWQPNKSCGSRALMPEWVLWVSGSCLGRGNFKNCVTESIGDGRNSARMRGGIFSGNMMNKRENKVFFIQHRFTQWATYQ